MIHEFTLILSGVNDLTPELNDALFEGGFDDCLVGVADGEVYIDVNHRESESLEQSVREAIRDVENTGLHVARVESAEWNVLAQINSELAPATQIAS